MIGRHGQMASDIWSMLGAVSVHDQPVLEQGQSPLQGSQPSPALLGQVQAEVAWQTQVGLIINYYLKVGLFFGKK